MKTVKSALNVMNRVLRVLVILSFGVLLVACPPGTPLEAPYQGDLIRAQEVDVGHSIKLDLRPHFRGLKLEYSAGSSEPRVVTASVAGHTLALTGRVRGQAQVTAVASNASGRFRHQFDVTVVAHGHGHGNGHGHAH
jgi:hypothetical protein